MRKLLEFLVAKRHWFLMIFFEILSFVLIYRNNFYQRNMMLSSANVVVGQMLSMSNTVKSYRNLREINRDLIERNNSLEMELIYLRNRVRVLEADSIDFNQVLVPDTVADSFGVRDDYIYDYIMAEVVNNSTIYANNYITLNKGLRDGVRPDMGVVSPQGVAGIVVSANEHFSIVIPLLNTRAKVNCRVKNTRFFGGLSWRGDDTRFAYLEELPTHAIFEVGDTILTSGYSDIFPEGLMVGVVESYDKQHDDNFFSLKVRLATDFNNLDMLGVIINKMQQEQREIEEEMK